MAKKSAAFYAASESAARQTMDLANAALVQAIGVLRTMPTPENEASCRAAMRVSATSRRAYNRAVVQGVVR